jgi:protein phosphatase
LGSVELPAVDFRLRFSAEDDDQQALANQGARLKPGDILLLCSDGLTDLVWDDEILRLITTRNTLESAAEDLVARANEGGGHDNITAILIAVPRRAPAASQKKKGFLRVLLGD